MHKQMARQFLVFVTIGTILTGCTAEPDVTPTQATSTPDGTSRTEPIQADAGTSAGPASDAMTVSREPSPTPTADANALPWLIGPAGIGPFVLGSDFANYYHYSDTQPSEGLDRCPVMFLDISEQGHDFRVVVDGSNDSPILVQGVVLSVGANGSTPAQTSAGVGIGSTIEQVRSAYPDAIEETYPFDLYQVEAVNVSTTVDGVPIAFQVQGDPGVVTDVAVGLEFVPYEYCG